MNENRYITEESLIRFHRFLQQEERSRGTIEKYMRDVNNFAAWIEDQSSLSSGYPCCKVTKDTAIRWKQYLLQSGKGLSFSPRSTCGQDYFLLHSKISLLF